MAFCSYYRGYTASGYTVIPNAFIDEHIPVSNGDCVRVYLYGLMLCERADGANNTIEDMSATLGLKPEDIISAYEYWEQQGLIHFVNDEIKYLPITRNSAKIRKLPKGKYDDFNAKAQSLLDGRMVTTTEFSNYYSFMESMHFEPNALLLVIKECVTFKGFNVGYHYILTVAKGLAYSAILTQKQVAEKFNYDRQNTKELEHIIKSLRQNASGKADKKKDFIHHSYDPEKIKEIGKNAGRIEF
jgi:hypothetical protein